MPVQLPPLVPNPPRLAPPQARQDRYQRQAPDPGHPVINLHRPINDDYAIPLDLLAPPNPRPLENTINTLVNAAQLALDPDHNVLPEHYEPHRDRLRPLQALDQRHQILGPTLAAITAKYELDNPKKTKSPKVLCRLPRHRADNHTWNLVWKIFLHFSKDKITTEKACGYYLRDLMAMINAHQLDAGQTQRLLQEHLADDMLLVYNGLEETHGVFDAMELMLTWFYDAPKLVNKSDQIRAWKLNLKLPIHAQIATLARLYRTDTHPPHVDVMTADIKTKVLIQLPNKMAEEMHSFEHVYKHSHDGAAPLQDFKDKLQSLCSDPQHKTAIDSLKVADIGRSTYDTVRPDHLQAIRTIAEARQSQYPPNPPALQTPPQLVTPQDLDKLYQDVQATQHSTLAKVLEAVGQHHTQLAPPPAAISQVNHQTPMPQPLQTQAHGLPDSEFTAHIRSIQTENARLQGKMSNVEPCSPTFSRRAHISSNKAQSLEKNYSRRSVAKRWTHTEPLQVTRDLKYHPSRSNKPTR